MGGTAPGIGTALDVIAPPAEAAGAGASLAAASGASVAATGGAGGAAATAAAEGPGGGAAAGAGELPPHASEVRTSKVGSGIARGAIFKSFSFGIAIRSRRHLSAPKRFRDKALAPGPRARCRDQAIRERAVCVINPRRGGHRCR